MEPRRGRSQSVSESSIIHVVTQHFLIFVQIIAVRFIWRRSEVVGFCLFVPPLVYSLTQHTELLAGEVSGI